MQLINQSYEILGTPKTVDEAWEFVELAARNCYQSERKDNTKSAEQWCRDLLLKHADLECNHMSPFAFGVVYLQIPKKYDEICNGYVDNPYSRTQFNGRFCYVTTNLRVLIENDWMEDLQYAFGPTPNHVKACAFKLVTSRAVMAEITRHTSLWFAIESTRYCNYSKDKFGNELTFIKPCWFTEGWEVNSHTTPELVCVQEFNNIEQSYNFLTNDCKWKPQQAATILPNALKTTIMMCGYEDSLLHMFRLRAEECSGPVHPQMAELMKPLYEDYKNWIG